MTEQKNIAFFNWVKLFCKDAVAEYQFCPVRKFRADVYVPSLNLLIEYEGINASKSGHTTASGYTKDCEKYNIASLMGFRLLRYTALNKTDLQRDLEALKNGFNPVAFKTQKQRFKEFLKQYKKMA